MSVKVLSTIQTTFLGTHTNPYFKAEVVLAESAVFPRQRDLINHLKEEALFFLRVKLPHVTCVMGFLHPVWNEGLTTGINTSGKC